MGISPWIGTPSEGLVPGEEGVGTVVSDGWDLQRQESVYSGTRCHAPPFDGTTVPSGVHDVLSERTSSTSSFRVSGLLS